MKMKEFLETIPPYQEVEIEDINSGSPAGGIMANKTEVYIYCEKCNGERFFGTYSSHIYDTKIMSVVYRYTCKNCNESNKYFVLLGQVLPGDNLSGKLIKIGEYPIFGPPTPSKLISLIGSDRDNFLKGRQCENQGLGIGSFAYYRRVIESQKNKIIDQMLKICKLSEKNELLIEQLEQAKIESQFSTAIDLIKQNLPSSLLINGHNPLKLLHSALSKGLHEMTDEECLAKANSIRLILTELCLRMNEMLKDDKELKNAISSLLNPNQEPPHTR